MVSRCSQLPEAESERRPRCSSAVAVKVLNWALTSLVVVSSVVKLAEPKVLAAGSEVWTAGHAVQSSGPMVVEPWQVPVPMGSHWLRVPLEPALVLAASTVAGFGLEFVKVSMHSLMAAGAVDTEQTSRVVEAALVLGPGPTLAVGPDVVEPTVAAAGPPAEVVPKGVVLGLFAVVESTVVDEEEAELAVALPKGPGAAAFALVGLEVDPTLAALAAYSVVAAVPMVAELVSALEGGPRLDEHGSGVALAPQVDSMTAGFEGSMWLSVLGAVLVPEGTDALSTEAGMGTDLLLLPEAGLDATTVMTAAVAFALVTLPRSSAEPVGSNLQQRSRPRLRLAETVLGVPAQGESACVDPLWCSQEPPGGQEGERAQRQVQGLSLAPEQAQTLLSGPQQVWKRYFQVEPRPGWPALVVGTREDNWDSPQALEPLVEDSYSSERTEGNYRPRPQG